MKTLKNIIINSLSEGNNVDLIMNKINSEYKKNIDEINEKIKHSVND